MGCASPNVAINDILLHGTLTMHTHPPSHSLDSLQKDKKRHAKDVRDKKGDCTVERCDTQSSQRDSEEVNSVEVLCPCFQLRQTRLSHEHNTFTSPVFVEKEAQQSLNIS